jgi:hypothetical protein
MISHVMSELRTNASEIAVPNLSVNPELRAWTLYSCHFLHPHLILLP